MDEEEQAIQIIFEDEEICFNTRYPEFILPPQPERGQITEFDGILPPPPPIEELELPEFMDCLPPPPSTDELEQMAIDNGRTEGMIFNYSGDVDLVDLPVREEDVPGGPAQVEDVPSSPARVEDVLIGPARVEDVLTGPVLVEDVLTGPAQVEDVLSGPALVEDVLTDPVRVEDVLSSPAVVEDVLSRPVRVEDVLIGQARVEDILSGPAREEDVLSGTARVEDVLSGPVHVEDVLTNNVQSGQNYEIVSGRTKKSKIYKFENHLYRTNRKGKTSTFMICTESSTNLKCQARATLNHKKDTMSMTKEHNHNTKAHEASVNKLRHELLDAAGISTDKTLHQIFMDMTEKHPFGKFVTYKSLEPGMRKRRQALFPNIPKNIDEIPNLMNSAQMGLDDHYKGLLKTEDGTSVGVLFYKQELFDQLESKTSLAYDGTFFVTPHPFYQLWTVFFIKGGQYFPALSILFLGKHSSMYDAAWAYIKEKLPNFMPVTAGGDFEEAAQKAAEKQIPSLVVKFCLFHYCQAVIKNGQKL